MGTQFLQSQILDLNSLLKQLQYPKEQKTGRALKNPLFISHSSHSTGLPPALTLFQAPCPTWGLSLPPFSSLSHLVILATSAQGSRG